MDWNELPMMGNSDDDDDEDPNNDPFTIKVNDLWSMKTAEKLDDLLESITNTLLYREHKWVPPGTTRKPSTQKTDFDKLFETSMKMIDSPNENRFKYQFSARRILMLIAKYLDCDQTKLVYNTCIRQLQIDPCDKQYSKELVGFSACCLSRLNFEHVLTKEQAGDLMKELIPLASRIFIAELSHLDPKKRFALIRKDGYLFPIDYIGSDQVVHLYPILIGFLFALARYSGFDEYYEYAKSVFYDAESKRVVGGDVMVVLNIMLIINERIMLGYDADPCSRRRFSYAFLEELSEFTMRLISISRDFIRGTLVFIIKNRLRSAISYCNPMKHGEIADTLVDHFISRHDDPTADYFIITVFEEMFGLMILPIVFEGKEEAIREKFDRLNLSPEWREPFRVLLYPPDEVL